MGEFQLVHFLLTQNSAKLSWLVRYLILVTVPPMPIRRPRAERNPEPLSVSSERAGAEHIACCCPQKEGMRLRVEGSGKASVSPSAPGGRSSSGA